MELFTKRQLIQSIGQFLITFATGLVLADSLTWRTVAIAALQALIVAGGVLGFSYVPPPEKK